MHGPPATWPCRKAPASPLDLEARPDTKALHALGERWRPLRGVAAHCLWAYYGLMRARPATLEETPKIPSPPTAARRKKRIS